MKKTVILDLDETLIHTKGLIVYFRPGLVEFLQKIVVLKDKLEVIVWTSSHRLYAERIIKYITEQVPSSIDYFICRVTSGNYYAFDALTNCLVDSVFRNPDYLLSNYENKRLLDLDRNLPNCLAIDNLSCTMAYNKNNGIVINSFIGKPDNALEILAGILKDYAVFPGETPKFLKTHASVIAHEPFFYINALLCTLSGTITSHQILHGLHEQYQIDQERYSAIIGWL